MHGAVEGLWKVPRIGDGVNVRGGWKSVIMAGMGNCECTMTVRTGAVHAGGVVFLAYMTEMLPDLLDSRCYTSEKSRLVFLPSPCYSDQQPELRRLRCSPLLQEHLHYHQHVYTAAKPSSTSLPRHRSSPVPRHHGRRDQANFFSRNYRTQSCSRSCRRSTRSEFKRSLRSWCHLGRETRYRHRRIRIVGLELRAIGLRVR